MSRLRRDDNRTYLFDFMLQPPECIANPDGPYNEMNYCANLVRSFGGAQKTYDLDTGNMLSTSLTKFTNWTIGKVPDYEYDYPMKLETCY